MCGCIWCSFGPASAEPDDHCWFGQCQSRPPRHPAEDVAIETSRGLHEDCFSPFLCLRSIFQRGKLLDALIIPHPSSIQNMLDMLNVNEHNIQNAAPASIVMLQQTSTTGSAAQLLATAAAAAPPPPPPRTTTTTATTATTATATATTTTTNSYWTLSERALLIAGAVYLPWHPTVRRSEPYGKMKLRVKLIARMGSMREPCFPLSSNVSASTDDILDARWVPMLQCGRSLSDCACIICSIMETVCIFARNIKPHLQQGLCSSAAK